MRLRLTVFSLFCVMIASCVMAAPVEVGFGEADITPDVNAKPVWIAGYSQNRRAEGVHDPLHVRSVVLRDGKDKVAMACLDVVGLDYAWVQAIREKLNDFKYVMVSAAHNHEGPDTMGIWGPGPTKSGIDPEYMDRIAELTVQVIRQADESAVPAVANYGTASDEELLRDSREPYIFDPVLRALRFNRADNGKLVGIVLQWNCHPEAMGGDNKQITADFIGVTVDELKKKYGCPVTYFTGPVGGLMAPPRDKFKDEKGELLREGDFAFNQAYGEMVAALAAQAVDAAKPISLNGFVVSAKPVAIPLENKLYQMAKMIGILKRAGYAWQGDAEMIGDEITAKNVKEAKKAAVLTEVGYVRLGDLHVACIPGEIYPEHVYGKVQDPVDPGADYPDAPAEKSILESLPGDKVLIVGLANDEIGYILPLRQWDEKAPFCYGRNGDQYGEENSVGPQAAPIIYGALDRRVQEAK
jgi:hypothetical protein